MKALIISLLTLAGLLLASCGKAPEKKKIVRPVKAMLVGDVSSFGKAKLTGKARAGEEINVAFEVPGRITELPVEVGDLVKKDDELARLDSRDYQHAVDAAAAELERADSRRERLAKVIESGAASAQELKNAEAQARVAAAAHEIAKKQLEDTAIVAPFAGRIAAKYVERFENILAKQKVLRLIDPSRIEMIVDVPERLIPNVPYVEKIEVTFAPFPGVKIPAKIKEIGSEASEFTRTYPVTLIMDQPGGVEILPGMTGEAVAAATLPLDRLAAGAPILPSAVFSSGQDSFVWIVDESTGVVSKQQVEVDRFTPVGVIVTKGIKPGQWIVTAGVHSLTDGQVVRILDY